MSIFYGHFMSEDALFAIGSHYFFEKLFWADFKVCQFGLFAELSVQSPPTSVNDGLFYNPGLRKVALRGWILQLLSATVSHATNHRPMFSLLSPQYSTLGRRDTLNGRGTSFNEFSQIAIIASSILVSIFVTLSLKCIENCNSRQATNVTQLIIAEPN